MLLDSSHNSCLFSTDNGFLGATDCYHRWTKIQRDEGWDNLSDSWCENSETDRLGRSSGQLRFIVSPEYFPDIPASFIKKCFTIYHRMHVKKFS